MASRKTQRQNLEGAKYMTGSLGDVHPKVARHNEKSENAMMLSYVTRRVGDGSAIAAALREGIRGRAAAEKAKAKAGSKSKSKSKTAKPAGKRRDASAAARKAAITRKARSGR